MLASYDMLAVAVCDPAGRLLGAVTVDDVLDRQLGAGWRQRERRPGPGRHEAACDGQAPRRPHRRLAPAGASGCDYDSDAFGRFSETIARFFGTARFLVFQTVIVVVWIVINLAP